VPAFKMALVEVVDGAGRLRVLKALVIIHLRKGEHVSYSCIDCRGSAKTGFATAHGRTVQLATPGLTVSSRSLLRIDVTAPRKNGRFKLYSIHKAQTAVRRQGCLAPVGVVITCPK
jgi:hypothetical protein